MKTDTTNKNCPPEGRIAAIRSSLRSFVFSLVGLAPLIGLPFSVAALVQVRKARRNAGPVWNPAERYLKAAGAIAPLGLLTSFGFLVLVCRVIPAFLRGLGSCGSGST